jgi:hypothetical protein
MPLCKKDQSNPTISRDQSCVDEHMNSKCQTVGCYGSDRQYSNFPKEKQVQLVTNRNWQDCKELDEQQFNVFKL